MLLLPVTSKVLWPRATPSRQREGDTERGEREESGSYRDGRDRDRGKHKVRGKRGGGKRGKRYVVERKCCERELRRYIGYSIIEHMTYLFNTLSCCKNDRPLLEVGGALPTGKTGREEGEETEGRDTERGEGREWNIQRGERHREGRGGGKRGGRDTERGEGKRQRGERGGNTEREERAGRGKIGGRDRGGEG